MPLVKGKLFEGRINSDVRLGDPMIQSTPHPAHRAVAISNVVEIRIDFESYSAAVTGACVCPLHVLPVHLV